MKVYTIQRFVIDSTLQTTSPEESNDTNQSILIRFISDMIQKLMIRIKMHYIKETKAERIIDTNRKGLNRINNLEKKFCH